MFSYYYYFLFLIVTFVGHIRSRFKKPMLVNLCKITFSVDWLEPILVALAIVIVCVHLIKI